MASSIPSSPPPALEEALFAPPVEGEVPPEEMQAPSPTGLLQGGAKMYTFSPQPMLSLPETFATSLAALPKGMNPSHERLFTDSKQGNAPAASPLYSKEEVRVKELKTPASHSEQHLESSTQKPYLPQPQPTATRAHAQAKEVFTHTPSFQGLPKTPLFSPARSPLHPLKKEGDFRPLAHKEASRLNESTRRRENEAPAKRPSDSPSSKAPQEESLQKQQTKEEGWAEQERKHKQEQEGNEGEEKGVSPINEVFARELVSYGLEESPFISQILKMRVSQFDVLILFIEILKLDIRSREQERRTRWDEREMELEHMQKVVENYKTQSQKLRTSSIGAGIMGIAAGLVPIVGLLKGDWILQKLGSIGSIFKRFQGRDPIKVFNSFSKMLESGSRMQQTMGEFEVKFAEGDRFFDEQMTSLYRNYCDERTRSMEEIKEDWKGIENFLYQILQMFHEATNHLYR